MKCDKHVDPGVQCRYCQRWLYFQCEGTAKEKVIREYPEEMQYISKKDKINQEERILESKCKTKITKLEQLKDNTKKRKKKRKT